MIESFTMKALVYLPILGDKRLGPKKRRRDTLSSIRVFASGAVKLVHDSSILILSSLCWVHASLRLKLLFLSSTRLFNVLQRKRVRRMASLNMAPELSATTYYTPPSATVRFK